MKAIIQDVSALENSSFDHLDRSEKNDIRSLVKDEKAIIICIEKSNDEKIYSVLEFYGDRIHVREVSGNAILKIIGALEVFCFALAKKYKKEAVSFCTSKDGIKWIGQRMGYFETPDGEYMKAVN